ncbi:MAG: hypothetical protein GOU98_03200 [Candidatus Altiarchaeota archaeon]|nr:hypothetical protein [Candidatus Altiarchaeota archaeon]
MGNQNVQKTYLFAVSPFKKVSDEDLLRMQNLGEVFVLEKTGDFVEQLTSKLGDKPSDLPDVLGMYAGDGGITQMFEVAQKYELSAVAIPHGTGNDIPIAIFDDQSQYLKISKKDAQELREKTFTGLENDSLVERRMDSLYYKAYTDDGQVLEKNSYIGHHLHLVAKAGQMSGVWNKLKKVGPLAYVLRGVAGIIKQDPTDFKVTLSGDLEKLVRVDGEPEWNHIGTNYEIDEMVWGGQILNTETTGGGKLRIEEESAYDSKFSFMYILSDEVPKRQLFSLSSKLNNSIYLNGVSAVRGIEKLVIESTDGFDFGVDGETSGDLFSKYSNGAVNPKVHKLEVEIKPGALNVYAPIIS